MNEAFVRALKENDCIQIIDHLQPLIYKHLSNVPKTRLEEFKQEYYLAIIHYVEKFNGNKEE